VALLAEGIISFAASLVGVIAHEFIALAGRMPSQESDARVSLSAPTRLLMSQPWLGGSSYPTYERATVRAGCVGPGSCSYQGWRIYSERTAGGYVEVGGPDLEVFAALHCD
jgi:hypothetical protein